MPSGRRTSISRRPDVGELLRVRGYTLAKLGAIAGP
jgi:hypothetical protein